MVGCGFYGVQERYETDYDPLIAKIRYEQFLANQKANRRKKKKDSTVPNKKSTNGEK